jgi:hypothetical protein
MRSAAHLKKPMASSVTENATMPKNAKAASQIFKKDSAACPKLTVPSRSEAKAPIPAAKPSRKPNGRLTIKKSVTTKTATATTEM